MKTVEYDKEELEAIKNALMFEYDTLTSDDAINIDDAILTNLVVIRSAIRRTDAALYRTLSDWGNDI